MRGIPVTKILAEENYDRVPQGPMMQVQNTKNIAATGLLKYMVL